MSFTSTLKGFGAWVAKEWTKIFNAAPQIEKVADAVLSYAAPALQIILGALDPPAAAVVGPIIAEVQKDLSVASGLIFDFGATPNAASILSTIESDLQSILTAGHIKDAALQSKLTTVITTIATLAQAILGAVKQPAGTATAN